MQTYVTRRWLVALATFSAVILVSQQVRSAAPAVQANAVAVLQARARAAGRVHVIVGHRAAYQPEKDLPDTAAIAAQRARFRQLTQQIVAAANGAIDRVKNFETIPYFAAEVDDNAVAALAGSALVASVVEDVPRPFTLAQSGPLIGAPAAWDAGYSGQGWSVAILDTGVEAAHSFLTGKVVAEVCHSTTDASGASTSRSLCPGGVSSVSSAGAAAPCTVAFECGHGTHVAGIAAGHGPAFSGIGRDADIIAMQVFSQFSSPDCGGASSCLMAWDSDVVSALDDVYQLRTSSNIAAVNLSLGSGVYSSSCDATSPAMTAAIDQLRSAGTATVIAAGNSGSSTGLSFPSCISRAVSVGSTNKSDVISTFSNASNLLALLAPGESIYSSLPGNTFGYMSGTSMAAPHVTGAWAVLKQRKPTATVDEVLATLRATGQPIVDTRGGGSSYPRIRVDAAVSALRVADPLMRIEVPGNSSVVEPFVVAGWAIDRGSVSDAGVDAVHVWAYPFDGSPPLFIGATTSLASRNDVANVFGARFVQSGFSVSVQDLSPGSYVLTAAAHSTVTGDFNQIRSVVVTIPSTWPAMSLDVPSNSATVGSSFFIGGWAIDYAARSGTGVDAVHIWAFPVAGGSALFLGAAAYGGSRPDVGAVFGSRFENSGYAFTASGLSPGAYDIAVYARSTLDRTFNQNRVVRVTVGQ
jgi:subtilisin family serine protease